MAKFFCALPWPFIFSWRLGESFLFDMNWLGFYLSVFFRGFRGQLDVFIGGTTQASSIPLQPQLLLQVMDIRPAFHKGTIRHNILLQGHV